MGNLDEVALGRNLVQRVNLADALRRSAALYRDKIALRDDVGTVTYGDLHREVNRVAQGLLDAGVDRGDFVALLYRNHIDFFKVYYACARMGAIALPLNPYLTDRDLKYMVDQTAAGVLFAQGDLAALARRVAGGSASVTSLILSSPFEDGAREEPSHPEDYESLSLEEFCAGEGADVERFVDDRDTLQCIYTSGTTAQPKGVLTSHLAVTFTALAAAHHMRVHDGDKALVVLPIHHVGGLNDVSIPHLFVGGEVVLIDGWNVDKVARSLQDFGITATMLTAPMWIELIRANQAGSFDWSAMKTALYAIASLPPERSAELRSLCPNADVLLCSGQTEFTGYEEGQRREHQITKPLAWGEPTLMTDIAIMDDEGRILPPNQVGEIVYRGPQAMTEYFANPTQTTESFQYGWFHSGDLGYLDDDHTCFFVDRKKDMIKTGGENVASVEIAHVLLAHPAVADCAVVGLPHERWTEAITAFVQVSAGSQLTEEEALAHCRDHLAPFKVPKRILFLDDFPRTASGKIQKVHLRSRYEGLYSSSDSEVQGPGGSQEE